MERVTIEGIEGQKGVGKASGKPYDMGRIYTVARLAPAMGDGIAKGRMGTAIECESTETIKRIAHLSFPLEADCDIQTVVRFGKPERMCFDIKPVSSAATK